LVKRTFSALGVASAAAYLILLPFAHATALRSLSLLLAAGATVALFRRPGRSALPMLGVFAVWLVASAVSLLSTSDLQASLRAIENEVLRSCLVFLVFYTLVRAAPAWTIWAAATGLGFGLLSGLVVSEFYLHAQWTGYWVPPLGDFTTGALTVLPLLVGYLALPARRSGVAWLACAAIVAILIAGYLSFSRAFWLVLMCGAVTGAMLYVRQGRRFDVRFALPLVVVCCGCLALASAAAMEKGHRALADSTERVVIYTAVASKIVENPPTGTGYGHETDKSWYAAAMPHWSVFHAHNMVLSYLDQMGALGLAALLAIFGVPAWLFARNLHNPSAEARMAALCGITLLLVVLAKNSFDYFFIKQNLWLFFAHLGLYLGALDARSDSKAFSTSATDRSRTFPLAG
jgi:O-antigen ligase